MKTENVTSNKTYNRFYFDGGILAMSATGTFDSTVVTLYWAGNKTDTGIEVGNLSEPGKIDATVDYGNGYYWIESTLGTGSADINVAYGRNAHPVLENQASDAAFNDDKSRYDSIPKPSGRNYATN